MQADIFAEVEAILKRSRERGVLVEERDPLTGARVTYRVRRKDGREIREQIFPPPVAPPRRRLRQIKIRAWWVLPIPAAVVVLRLLGWL